MQVELEENNASIYSRKLNSTLRSVNVGSYLAISSVLFLLSVSIENKCGL